ncbi:(4Fe-4S)-binding protein [Gelidibacter japonicus]|uniref:(4Fe-4S)-binding protein n=1 Tax=Gelidibacter japonicus TaxID=1962232 RepID=UPI003A93EA2F|tara:strand:- start:1701 stop:2117 length:417 start_codon:yes stop_codon:yes gene_type:complete
MEKIKEYSNNEVTVVWKPNLCIHSAKCVHGLPEVFKPKEKPWIQIDNATTNSIIAAVKACPSGALTYYSNTSQGNEEATETSTEATKIEIVNGGPMLVHGTLIITHDDGSEEEKKRITAFCRCAKSENKPYCDGSHNL